MRQFDTKKDYTCIYKERIPLTKIAFRKQMKNFGQEPLNFSVYSTINSAANRLRNNLQIVTSTTSKTARHMHLACPVDRATHIKNSCQLKIEGFTSLGHET